MVKQIMLVLSALILINTAYAAEQNVTLKTEQGELAGSLLMPANKSETVVLIIAGSGPTDRNGNNTQMTNNALKMVAQHFAKDGIASLRYDKRGVAASAPAAIAEQDLRFEHYVNDATGWITYLQQQHGFKRIFVAGHSEGSLVGMMATAKSSSAGFISIAGLGRSGDVVLKEQLASNPAVFEQSEPIIDKLVVGETVDNVNPLLNALFRPSIQPYLMSWIKYDPAKEIKRLSVPVLIVQGTTDIQVKEVDAKALSAAYPKAKLVIIEGMNHVLKDAPKERMANFATYMQPDTPLSESLMPAMTSFIKANESL
ncbi:alpha/beta hydrolase [Thalassotalea agarivorans]|uniref:Serine aminopeptidase S33 domain-containing protein n=1 Tax=Thalassotalea agarivorans TaxID=349064 RepID=A0A1I0BKS3_THASX|nr:alpha/beta fold hydrolase [Thalassotalea agarivorans]SET07530.1 hypothetical protein SAMN05660429_00982 [Thalassotalea agarivorans]